MSPNADGIKNKLVTYAWNQKSSTETTCNLRQKLLFNSISLLNIHVIQSNPFSAFFYDHFQTCQGVLDYISLFKIKQEQKNWPNGSRSRNPPKYIHFLWY